MAEKEKNLKSRILVKRDSSEHWGKAENTFAPMEGEIIFYTDLNQIKIGKKDANGNDTLLKDLKFLQVTADEIGEHSHNDLYYDIETMDEKLTVITSAIEGLEADLESKAGKDVATQETAGLFSAEDKKKLDGIESGAGANIADNDATVTLAEALYTYVPIGNAQKASNKVIGSGSAISASNPGKLGDAGDSLKSVFNKLFGTETAAQPTVNKSLSLSVSCDKSSITSSKEVGESVSATTATYTISLSNSATVSYGYRCGSTNTTGSKTVYYPATKAYNNSTAQVKITLPSNNTGDTAVTMTKGTLVNSTTTGNILYCNFKESDGKVIAFTVKYPAANYTTSSQTRYGKVEAEVTLGNAQTENTNNATVTTTNANKIDAFLAYKPVSNSYEDGTASISGGVKDDDISAITITSGYVPYAWELATSARAANSTLPSTRSKAAYTNIPITNGNGSTWLYIYVPSSVSISKITNGGFAAPHTSDGSVTLKVNNEKTATFNVYHVNGKVASGTNNYEITY